MTRRGPYILRTPLRPHTSGGCPRCDHHGIDRGCSCCRNHTARPAGNGKRRGTGWTKSPYRKTRRNRRQR